MPHQVTMPMLGLTMEEGTITEWLKHEGDAVAKEEPLFVVETDKSAVEVGAPASGTSLWRSATLIGFSATACSSTTPATHDLGPGSPMVRVG